MGRINFKEFNQRDAHDINGFDTEMIDWAEFDDGYGNQVAHGEQSVLHMTQRCGRQPWAKTEGGEEGYGLADAAYPIDTEPYTSKRQARFFHAAAQRGDISEKTVKEYDKATDFKHLPERAKKK